MPLLLSSATSKSPRRALLESSGTHQILNPEPQTLGHLGALGVLAVQPRTLTRYATPIDLTKHPELVDVLEARVLDVAEYLAWRDSPFVTDVPERVWMLYDETSRWFSSLAAGAIDLPASSPPASRTAADDAPRFTTPSRPFTHDELDGL